MRAMLRNVIAGLAYVIGGCAMSMAQPVTGSLVNLADGAVAATGKPLGSKQGKACAKSLFGVIGYGDASIATAAKNAGIREIATVDAENLAVLGIFAKNCTRVTGE